MLRNKGISDCLIVIVLVVTFNCIHLSTSTEDDKLARTLREHNKNDGLGTYSFRYETSNDIAHYARGQQNEEGDLSVRGGYAYVGTDGLVYVVKFTADATGYHPVVKVLTLEEAKNEASTKRVIHSSSLVASLLG